MQHRCRELLGNPHLAATYTISAHTSRKGSAGQKTFQTKILMFMHSLHGQNILSEFPPPLPALRNPSLQAGPALFSSCQGAGCRCQGAGCLCQGAQCQRTRGRTHPACTQSGRTRLDSMVSQAFSNLIDPVRLPD